ncbi:MAG: hypothetical protein KJZ80_13725 [Hyphomicrobiaceae bacterium]|nr:hypothetical protein [Hyphomicrobiaceae bacterium]
MDDITTIEIGAALLAFWLVTLFGLLKLIDRRDHPGPVKSAVAKELLMLVHLAMLIAAAAMLVKGTHIAG